MAYAEAKMEWRKTQRVASAYDDGKGDVFKDTRALTKAELEQLKELYQEVEDKIEGVKE